MPGLRASGKTFSNRHARPGHKMARRSKPHSRRSRLSRNMSILVSVLLAVSILLLVWLFFTRPEFAPLRQQLMHYVAHSDIAPTYQRDSLPPVTALVLSE